MLGGFCESHHCTMLHANESRSWRPCGEPNVLLQMVIHRDTSPQLLIYFFAVRHLCSPIVLKIYVWNCQSSERATSSSFFASFSLSAGASYARLLTPPQAQQDLLVLTMPAPQGSRAACWVPHFSAGIPANAVGLPQECFLTTASVIGTNREQERERGKGNTVIKLDQMEVSHTATVTN